MASNLEKWFNSDAILKIGLDEFFLFSLVFGLDYHFQAMGIFLEIIKMSVL